jgi:hypothetical protein
MVGRYIKIVVTAIAALFMLTIETPPALAQKCPARTCSEAFERCMSINCHQEKTGGGHCYAHCNAERDKCMQTGEFYGHVCQDKGLIRK